MNVPVDYYRDVIRAGGFSTTMTELRRRQYKHLIETYGLEGKKFIEVGGVEGHKKGGDAHSAAVVGDTVGDPLKDTVGPCLDIFIKIMSTISLVTVVVFGKYNLIEWIEKLF